VKMAVTHHGALSRVLGGWMPSEKGAGQKLTDAALARGRRLWITDAGQDLPVAAVVSDCNHAGMLQDLPSPSR